MKEASPVVGGLLMIHKIITRGLTISITKCDEFIQMKGIPNDEVPGFSKYVTTLKWVTHAHHLSEDEIAFPYFRSTVEAPFDQLKDDHQIIAGVLTEIEKCLSEISKEGPGRLREVLGEFEKLWTPHIGIEEKHFTPEKVNQVIAIEDQLKTAGKLASHGSKNSGPGPLAVPFMFYNLEGKDRELFMMPFPWIVKRVLVPVIWKKQWNPMIPYLLQTSGKDLS